MYQGKWRIKLATGQIKTDIHKKVSNLQWLDFRHVRSQFKFIFFSWQSMVALGLAPWCNLRCGDACSVASVQTKWKHPHHVGQTHGKTLKVFYVILPCIIVNCILFNMQRNIIIFASSTTWFKSLKSWSWCQIKWII